MEARTIIRNIIVALVSIGLVVLVVVLFVKGFSRHPSTPVNRVDVTKYTYSSSIATILVDGPTNLDQDHRQIRISVSGTENEIDVIQGYQGNVIKTQKYSNNTAGYGVFLQSLGLMNYSKGTSSKVDYRGFCPTGNRYVYSFSDGQNSLFSYWSTSCGGQGTAQGNVTAIRQLFERQIPTRDFNTFLSGTGVNF